MALVKSLVPFSESETETEPVVGSETEWARSRTSPGSRFHFSKVEEDFFKVEEDFFEVGEDV